MGLLFFTFFTWYGSSPSRDITEWVPLHLNREADSSSESFISFCDFSTPEDGFFFEDSSENQNAKIKEPAPVHPIKTCGGGGYCYSSTCS
jgi:hypothetical protein